MDKCPYCGAETRQGDNFCLNCGNRLLSATPAPLDQQAGISEATVANPEDWNSSSPDAASVSESSWGVDHSASAASASIDQLPTTREPINSTAQATMEPIQEPGYLVLRSDTGEALQEYPLDKLEVVIGRAPNSEILLSKDKLTSRRHATVHYENGQYLLQDEHSANGTFVNAQQLDEDTPYLLQDGDHVGIGEHELVFRAAGVMAADVEDLPTVAVPYEATQYEPSTPMLTYQEHDHNHDHNHDHDDDGMATVATSDDYASPPPEPNAYDEIVDYGQGNAPVSPMSEVPSVADYTPAALPAYKEPSGSGTPEPAPVAATYQPEAAKNAPADSGASSDVSAPADNTNVTLSRFSAIAVPPLPDMTSLMAALSSLDGQIMSLQGQFNATQDALKRHDTEIGSTAGQLRTSIRRISERMETTIADVARSREALAWVELLQLMEDVMNNPRDIEYVTKLARKARELNKVFQIHQNVLNTMAECNNQLRSLIGEEK